MGMNQTIRGLVDGPVYSNGAAIFVTHRGAIDGGPTGVAAISASITTLANRGTIVGGVGPSQAGGAGVLNENTIRTLTNHGLMAGGGGSGSGAAGGSGVRSAGTIRVLTNDGTIRGGGGAGSDSSAGAGAPASRTPVRSRP